MRVLRAGATMIRPAHDAAIGAIAIFVCWCAAVALAPETVTTAASTAELPPEPPSVAVVTTPATRGTARQVTPTVPPPSTLPPVAHYDTWLRLAECESGGNWAINTGNGYYGGLQFSLTSWRAVDGDLYASRPDLATPLQQMSAAERLLAIQGWGAWPTCSRKLGLR
jgi:hypothetical protein